MTLICDFCDMHPPEFPPTYLATSVQPPFPIHSLHFSHKGECSSGFFNKHSLLIIYPKVISSIPICSKTMYVLLSSTSIFTALITLKFQTHVINCLASAAAKLLQSCPTLCDPIDGSPPGSRVPGILQARTLEWVANSFSNA